MATWNPGAQTPLATNSGWGMQTAWTPQATQNQYLQGQQMNGQAHLGNQMLNGQSLLGINQGGQPNYAGGLYQSMMGGSGNPYIDQLSGQMQKDASNTLNQGLSNLDQRASAAGMAGSSRQGIAQGQIAQDVNSNLQSNLSNMRFQAFDKDMQNKMNIAQMADQNATQRYLGDQQYNTNLLGAANTNAANNQQYNLGMIGQGNTNAATQNQFNLGAGNIDLGRVNAGNQYNQGMNQNALSYNLGLDSNRMNYDLGLGQSNIAADASKYGANQSRIASMYGSDAQKAAAMYGSDQSRIASMYGSDMGYRSAQYGADSSLQSALANASVAAQRNNQDYSLGQGRLGLDQYLGDQTYNLGLNGQMLNYLGGYQDSMNTGMGNAGMVSGLAGAGLNSMQQGMNPYSMLSQIIGGPTVLTNGQSQSSGSSGGGGVSTVICTELKRQGILPSEYWDADLRFGIRTRQETPEVYDGYMLWAPSVVRAMKRSKVITKLVSLVAVPWAQAMAREMGVDAPETRVGKLIMRVGMNVCGMIGKRLMRAGHAVA